MDKSAKSDLAQILPPTPQNPYLAPTLNSYFLIPAPVLKATAQLLRYLRFKPDVWPEYPDKTDKKSDPVPDTSPATHVVEDDMETNLFEAYRPQTLSTGLLGPSELQTSPPPDNPDKNPDQPTLRLLSIHYPNTRVLAHIYANHPDEPEPTCA